MLQYFNCRAFAVTPDSLHQTSFLAATSTEKKLEDPLQTHVTPKSYIKL